MYLLELKMVVDKGGPRGLVGPPSFTIKQNVC